ncbi:MAG: endonuclease/exonuclease/phosphatase family protein [Thermoflavifilum aggregans]|nr:endonuclease/exonuclease/phosphatase family protein [Thermoflavifilum aggregans]
MRFALHKLFPLLFHLLMIGCSGLMLLAAWSPYADPQSWWPLAFLGLTFPLWLLVVIILWIFALLLRSKWLVLPTLALIGSWKAIRVTVALPHLSAPAEDTTSPVIKLMSYNVHDFAPYHNRPDPQAKYGRAMLQLIASQQPDIVCLQEFFTSDHPQLKQKDYKTYISDSLGYPYRYFSSDYNGTRSTSHSGVIIFSRWPICRAAKIPIIQHPRAESLIYADLVIRQDTVRVFTVHLQSIYLNQNDLMQIEEMKQGNDTAWRASRPIWSKLKRAFIRRSEESKRVKHALQQSPYPFLICGDFNDTPVSFTYFTIAKGLQDGFVKCGRGLGATYYSISPTLRIDYILADPNWHFLHFTRIPVHLSDHYPVVAELQLHSSIHP